MTTITLENVTKRFEDVTAVESIDLEVEDGEFLVVVGPSGCGKSTTLRMLAGLESVSEGRIYIGGRDVTGLDPKDRNVSMVFQNYALYPHMTAERNMTFGMKSAGSFSDDEIERRVSEAAETLGIGDLLARKPAELSGGERQRVALGRALVRDPEVFLMDEPLSNLDAKLRVQMRAELAKLHGELETTTVYVTHDQTEAMTLGDRVVVMNDGEIQQVDTAQYLYDYPNNQFVAGFIGEPAMNMVGVEVEGTDGETVVSHPGFRIRLPETDELRRFDAGRAVLGVRPEDLSIVETDGDGADTFVATVTVTEPLGDSLLLYCEVEGDELQVQSAPRSAIEPGDPVTLTVDRDRLHLFDRETRAAVYHSDGTRARTPEVTATAETDD